RVQKWERGEPDHIEQIILRRIARAVSVSVSAVSKAEVMLHLVADAFVDAKTEPGHQPIKQHGLRRKRPEPRGQKKQNQRFTQFFWKTHPQDESQPASRKALA